MADLKISELNALGPLESVDVDNDILPIAKNLGSEGNRNYTLREVWDSFKNDDPNPFPQYVLVGEDSSQIITYTTSRTSIHDDVGNYIRYDSETDVTYSIDQEGTLFPLSGEIHIEQVNTGKVTIDVALASDGQIVHETIFIPTTRGQHGVITIKKTVHGATRADDKFTVFGALEEALV